MLDLLISRTSPISPRPPPGCSARLRPPADRTRRGRRAPSTTATPAAAWILSLSLLTLGAAWGCGGDSPTAPGVVTVEVIPRETLLVGVGDGTGYAVSARDAEGRLVSVQPEWSIDRPEVASISERGFATALAAGTATVRATVGGATGTARLEVYLPPEIARYEPGESYLGRKGYAEYIPGRLPVILSSAHGGSMTPGEIPARSFGVVRNDRNSLELTLAMRAALIRLTGYAPHVILSHLHRSRLDANREIVEAAQENPFAERAWQEFQDWIRVARAAVAGEFQKGLYFDIHGHGHAIDRLELGYLLTAEELNRPDAALNSLEVVAQTSIRDLGRTSPIPFSQLLRGPASFGGLLAAEGVPSVPSPDDPGPGDAPYFRGGYNTRVHGSVMDAEVVSGIQLEHHYGGIRDTPANRTAYAEKVARVIRDFMREHYGFFEPESAAADGAKQRHRGPR